MTLHHLLVVMHVIKEYDDYSLKLSIEKENFSF